MFITCGSNVNDDVTVEIGLRALGCGRHDCRKGMDGVSRGMRGVLKDDDNDWVDLTGARSGMLQQEQGRFRRGVSRL